MIVDTNGLSTPDHSVVLNLNNQDRNRLNALTRYDKWFAKGPVLAIGSHHHDRDVLQV